MRNDRTPDCPRGLSAEAKRLWRGFHAEYELTDRHALAVLEAGLRAHDVAQEAARVVAEHGVAVVDKYGQLKPNPACAVMRDSRAQWLRALAALGLDLDLDRPGPGRPPARHPAVGV